MMDRRIHTHFLAAVVAASALMFACGDPSTPTLAQSQSQNSSGSDSAKLRSTGSLNFVDCGSAGCTAEGTIVSDGPGCVSNVKGVTHLLDASGKEIEAQSWTINGRVRPNAPRTYQACCFSSNSKERYSSFNVEITSQPIDCI